jgi:release factor glutamine methyltransferase
VLIPRPESELLVEKALDFFKLSGKLEKGETSGKILPTHDKPPTLEKVEKIAEIGTGSGAIAISLALILPKAKIYATDISLRALDIARVNCEKHKVRVHFLEGDLLDPLPEPVDIILANLPYIRDEELSKLSAEIRMFEPVEALAGGRQGLDKVSQLLGEARDKLRPRGAILVEIGPGQGQKVVLLARELFPGARVELAPDLAGGERVLSVTTS